MHFKQSYCMESIYTSYRQLWRKNGCISSCKSHFKQSYCMETWAELFYLSIRANFLESRTIFRPNDFSPSILTLLLSLDGCVINFTRSSFFFQLQTQSILYLYTDVASTMQHSTYSTHFMFIPMYTAIIKHMLI